MFRSYDHHQPEKYIATLGLLNWQATGYKDPTRSGLVTITISVFQPDDGRTTETCSYLYISNISSYDINVA
jgi:hypothetical protein